MCIVDRESITAAAKFIICRAECVETYRRDLMLRFKRFHYLLGAEIMGHSALVLTPDPTLPKVE